MNHETELKIQAHLDGELSAAESRRTAELVRTNAEARALYETLASARTTLSENEPQHALPESRDFYWSKIEREIRRQKQTGQEVSRTPFGWNRSWMRFALPVAGVAMVLALILAGSRFGQSSPSEQDWQGVEMTFQEASSITFHSDAENMTVVWVQSQ